MSKMFTLNTVSIFSYLAMIGGLVFLLMTGRLFSASPLVIVPQVAAIVLIVWARMTLGWRSFHVAANPTEGGLVTVGPYRYIRHPIYAAMCLFTVAGVAAHGSCLAFAVCGVVLGGALVRLWCEEALLKERYPQYREYAARTWRMIPYVF
jgi:protein-S-isoprenylcysteine O-methyltransferase Ste14